MNSEEEKMIINDLGSLGFKNMQIQEIIKNKIQKDIILKKEIFLNQFINN